MFINILEYQLCFAQVVKQEIILDGFLIDTK